MANHSDSEVDLPTILAFCMSLAREAGALIITGSNAMARTSDVGEKTNSVDLVTEFDVQVEELVKAEIRETYPTYKFIGEETYAASSQLDITDEPTFCVDPIDGTTNFVHGFPFVCISIGLIHKSVPVLGVIYNPFLDYMYAGVKGQGSYLTRGTSFPVRLPISTPKPLPSLSQALIAVEWGSDRTLDAVTRKSSSFLRLAGNPSQGVVDGRMAHSLRSLGSAALNFAMVAQGGMDIYWEIGCWPWDVCAGIVIAQEAGCMVTGSHEVFRHSSSNATFGDITTEILTGRKFIVVRAIADTEAEECKDAQKRIIKEFYDTVLDLGLDEQIT